MRKMFIVLACLSLIFMASNNLIASGGGGGGGGGGNGGGGSSDDPRTSPEPLYKSNEEASAGIWQDKNSVFKTMAGSLCFIDTSSQDNWIASGGGGGGGGGGNGDNNHTGPPLFPSKPQEKQATEGAKQDPKEVQEPLYKKSDFPPLEREPPKDFIHRAFCFIDTASQDSLLDQLFEFIWKPKTE